MLSDVEIERRVPIWHALSDIFLDTELQPNDYRWIGDQLRASGFSPEELRRIFEHEVFPAFIPNMLSVAGEWAGWTEESVREIMLHALRRGSVRRRMGWLLRRPFRSFLQEEWAKVAAEL